MNKIILILLLGLVMGSCREKKIKEKKKNEVQLTILDKIAQAHGYAQWNNVRELRFTLNADRDTTHFERTWIWKPQENEVIRIFNSDTIAYKRTAMDSTLYEVDAGFINDKYWLLAPFNLVWDRSSFSFEQQEAATTPISNEPMQKLTIVYGNEGGYTPGDAYDFFFEDDYVIKEWVFRKSNQAEPTIITTWEDYSTLGGLLISKMRKKEDSSWSLYFTNIEVH